MEQLANLRSIPNLCVIRPADGRETAAAWLAALRRKEGPTALILTRQDVPQLSGTSREAEKGAYILDREKGPRPDVILIASGSEVWLALQAKELLKEKGVDARVISMPSHELFQSQSPAYREEVLPAAIKRGWLLKQAIQWAGSLMPAARALLFPLTALALRLPGSPETKIRLYGGKHCRQGSESFWKVSLP